MKRKDITKMYQVLVEGAALHEVDPDLYDEDEDDALEIISPAYINRTGVEYGERVVYYEENYDPSAERLGERDSLEAKQVIDALEEYGIDFSTDLVAKFPADYDQK